MTAPRPTLHRTPGERLAVWLVTGPLGHFYSVAVDLAVFGARLIARRLQGRS